MRLLPLAVLALAHVGCGAKPINPTLNDPQDLLDPLDTAVDTDPDLTDDTGPAPSDDTASPADDTAEPTSVIPPGHPRLYFGYAELPALQARVFDFAYSEIVTSWDRYVSERRLDIYMPPAKPEVIVVTTEDTGADTGGHTTVETIEPEPLVLPETEREWGDWGDALPNLAMYALFTDDSTMYDLIKTWMYNLADFDHWGPTNTADVGTGAARTLQGMAIAFDMLYDELSMDERIELRTKLMLQGQRLYLSLTGDEPTPLATQRITRDNQVVNGALLTVAIVLEHEHPAAADWFDHVMSNIDGTLDTLASATGGGWPEGASLASDARSSLFRQLFLLERHYEDSRATHPWVNAQATAMAHETLPGLAEVIGIADGTGSWLRGPEHQACFIENAVDNGIATWLAQQHTALEETPSRLHEIWIEFLWCNPARPAAHPLSVGTSLLHHFSEMGVATFRRGWNSTDTALTFRAGPPGTQTLWSTVLDGTIETDAIGAYNQHPDAGSFTFRPDGVPLITDGRTEYPKRTELGNTYTFTPSHTIEHDWVVEERGDWWESATFESSLGSLSTVGQLGEWELEYGPLDRFYEDGANAEIRAAKHERDLMFMNAEYGGLYPLEIRTTEGWQDLGMDRVNRSLLLLPSDILVIIDHITHPEPMTHHAWFRSRSATFSPSGTSFLITDELGTTWSLDHVQPEGAILSTGSRVGDCFSPDGTWTEHGQVSTPVAEGGAAHLTILRKTTQSAWISTWEPSDLGVITTVNVTDEFSTVSYGVRIATDPDPVIRSAFLGFVGVASITTPEGIEVRF